MAGLTRADVESLRAPNHNAKASTYEAITLLQHTLHGGTEG